MYLCIVMAIVYQHRRLDTNDIFYIGIGKTISRSKSKKYRNNLWHKIVKKYGYNIEILHQDITWDEACILEKEYILKYGRIDLDTGILVNMTNGGEGISNISDEVRNKMSKSHKGKILSEETKKKISQSTMNRIVTEETRVKISNIHKGKIVSDLSKQKMSLSKKNMYDGKNNPMYGKKHSEFSKSKQSLARKNSNHPMTILNEEQVKWIRKNYIPKDNEFGCRAISRKLNIDAGTISKIINNKSWKDL